MFAGRQVRGGVLGGAGGSRLPHWFGKLFGAGGQEGGELTLPAAPTDELAQTSMEVDAGWELLREKLLAKCKRLDQFKVTTDLVAMHCACVNYLAAESKVMKNPDQLEIMEISERRLASATSEALSLVSFYDEEDDLIADTDEESQEMTGWVIER